MAFWGFSWGGRMGPIILALEDRFKVGILVSGGLASGKSLPEVDQINYVTRVTMPILMLNGLRDSVEPYATAQKPLFDLIGTHANDKRHVTFEGVGHLIPRTPAVRETINWLDRYLGPPESD
jgi:pimeloyl-ACP methyl ester carboxylesterase